MNIILLNIFILALGICAGLLIYYYSFQHFLINRCLLNSGNCARIRYKKLRNTALIELPNGYWVWFNGAEFFVYGYPIDKECTEGHSVAFIINSEDLALKGFQCAISLDEVFKIYIDIKYSYYFLNTLPCKRETDQTKCDTHFACKVKSGCFTPQGCPLKACQTETFGAVEVINLFLEEGIIHKTHLVTKSYKQHNPHPPTAPTAPAPKHKCQ